MCISKRILAVFLAISMCIPMTACGKEEEEPKKIESSIDISTDAEAVASVYTGQTDSDALLTETVKFPGAEEYSIDCPKDFSYEIVDENYPIIIFYPNDTSGDSIYTNITVALFQYDEIHQYMEKGEEIADKAMRIFLGEYLSATYGGDIKEFLNANFYNGDTYYGLTGFMKMDNSKLDPATDKNVSCVSEMRYFGPSEKYLVQVTAFSVDENIPFTYGLAKLMVESIPIGGSWRTCPKEVPAVSAIPAAGHITPPSPRKTRSKSSSKKNSKSSSQGYYWYDSDGDIWYFNGVENSFVGYGNDYYFDGDMLMESNDAGWDTLDDENLLWSDPGDTDDYFDYYSDSGDYYDEVDDDYYEAQDAEEYDDYNYDDSYDTYDSSDSYDSYDSYDDGGSYDYGDDDW